MTRSRTSSHLLRRHRLAIPTYSAGSLQHIRRFGTRHLAARSSATTQTRVRGQSNVLKRETVQTASSHRCPNFSRPIHALPRCRCVLYQGEQRRGLWWDV